MAYVRAARTARLRRGLIIVSVAVCAFLVADATRSLLAALQAVTAPPAGVVSGFRLIYLSGVGAGTLSFVVGVSYAAVVGMLVSVPLWRAHRRHYRQLQPLWAAMHRAFPQLRLGRVPATSWRARLGWDSAHYRFYRRVVEIRDGLVLLGPYYDISATGGAEHDEGRWAAVIHAALRAREAESPIVDADPVLLPGGDDLESDARVLAGIARAFAGR
ncbi:MAB_1171c family putative transporter [Actinoplanes nipponensis]|uniref:MAB_1171c family putative transporter n=1 Tax=Actinoplanes nipponensis TaxID=135950 RepID=UPI0031E8029B